MANSCQKNILIVDDSEANRLLLAFILEELGFLTDEAANGEIAVEKALEFEYAAVFMDINMPVMNGEEATEILGNLLFEAPIIACSAEDNPTKIQHFLASGFSQYVAKPVEPEVVEKALQRCGVNNSSQQKADDSAFQEKLGQLGNRFINNLPVMIRKVETAVQSQSFVDLKRIAHKLKGTASQFGFDNVAKIGRDIESAINKDKNAIALEKASFLIDELTRIKNKI